MKSSAKRSDKKLGASGSGENSVKSGSGWSIGVQAIFCQGGTCTICPNIFANCPNFYEAVGKKRGSYDAITQTYI